MLEFLFWEGRAFCTSVTLIDAALVLTLGPQTLYINAPACNQGNTVHLSDRLTTLTLMRTSIRQLQCLFSKLVS